MTDHHHKQHTYTDRNLVIILKKQAQQTNSHENFRKSLVALPMTLDPGFSNSTRKHQKEN
jgi:hypothetical protein